MPAYKDLSRIRAVINEIPYNNGGEVTSPNTIFNATVAVSNNKLIINLDQNLDSAYTIDLYAL